MSLRSADFEETNHRNLEGDFIDLKSGYFTYNINYRCSHSSSTSFNCSLFASIVSSFSFNSLSTHLITQMYSKGADTEKNGFSRSTIAEEKV